MDELVSTPPRKRTKGKEESLEFDQCPRAVNVTEFVEARALEITQLLAVVNNAALPVGEVAQGPRTFVQRLPRHMRRRAMSYNIKRLPRRTRPMAKSTIDGSKHRKKPPSRRWRRRPRNLLNAYLRRQRSVHWLETHIWHAKRFRMNELYGWKIPHRSYQRGFRAGYRDVTGHCVVQDISYYVCFELEGPEERLVENLNSLCHPAVSNTFSNGKLLNGSIEGRIILFQPGCYQWNCLGPVQVMYQPRKSDRENRRLWIWAHPALESQFLQILRQIFQLSEVKNVAESEESAETGRIDSKWMDGLTKYRLSKLFSPPTYQSGNRVILRILKHHFVRFRLLGPKSSSILSRILHEPTDLTYPTIFTTDSDWKHEWQLWKNGYSRMDPGAISPGTILALTALDPRLFTEYKKKLPDQSPVPNLNQRELSSQIPISNSPLWSMGARRFVLETKVSDSEINKICEMSTDRFPGDKINLIPILLIHQRSPNSQDHIGLGSGWDLVLPAGWAMPFWIALQYATSRAVGIQFQRHFTSEIADQFAGFPHLWPDTETGRDFNRLESEDLENRYFHRPINRRVNYDQLKITHPFSCPWNELMDGWIRIESGNPDGKFFILRDRIIIRKLEKALSTKSKSASIDIDRLCVEFPRALVAIRLESIGKGVPKRNALICMPTEEDLVKIRSRRTLQEFEPYFRQKWPLEKVEEKEINVGTERDFISFGGSAENGIEVDLDSFFYDIKEKRAMERKKKEKEKKKKRKNKKGKEDSGDEVKVAEYENIVESCERRILGYVVDGDYSLGNGKGRAIGFCSLLGLKEYYRKVEGNSDCVLHRNVQSTCYRAARLTILGP